MKERLGLAPEVAAAKILELKQGLINLSTTQTKITDYMHLAEPMGKINSRRLAKALKK